MCVGIGPDLALYVGGLLRQRSQPMNDEDSSVAAGVVSLMIPRQKALLDGEILFVAEVSLVRFRGHVVFHLVPSICHARTSHRQTLRSGWWHVREVKVVLAFGSACNLRF